MSERAFEAHGSDIEEAIQNGLKRLGLSRTDVIIDVVDEGRKGLLGLGSRDAVVRLIPLAGAQTAEEAEEAAPTRAKTAPAIPDPMPEPEMEAPLVDSPTPLSEVEETVDPEATVEAPPEEPEAALPEREPAAAEAPAPVAEEPADEQVAELTPSRPPAPERAPVPETGEENEGEVSEAVQEIVGTLLEQMGFSGAAVNVRQGEPDDRTGRVMTIVEIEGGNELKNLIGPHGEVLSDLQYVTRLMTGHVIKRRANFLLDVNGYRSRREEALAKLAERMAGKAVRRGEPVTLEAMNAYDRRIIHIALRDREDVYTNSVGEGANRRVRIYIQE